MPLTNSAPRQKLLPVIFTMRFSREQEIALLYAARSTPGCSSVSGVIRRAVDDWLERNHGEAIARMAQNSA
jgi:hypothetical protein